MGRFGQQTRLVAKKGRAEALVAKFIEAAEMQRDNPACDLMIAGKSTTEDDVVVSSKSGRVKQTGNGRVRVMRPPRGAP